MRGAALTLAILFSTAIVSAQRHHPAPPPPTPPRSNPNPFKTPPPPPTVLPFQLPMPQPTGGFLPGSVFPPKVNPAFTPGRSPGANGSTGAYGAPYFYVPSATDNGTTSSAAATPTGLLRLSGTPESAEVFVDGFYVATLGDAEAQRALSLAAGPHRIELRADGYTTRTFDVRIDASQTVTYRAALERQRAQPAEHAAAPAGATKMYLIPNCYLGNIPPKAERLPPGCDVKRVHVIS